jgi:hypothetical protein
VLFPGDSFEFKGGLDITHNPLMVSIGAYGIYSVRYNQNNRKVEISRVEEPQTFPMKYDLDRSIPLTIDVLSGDMGPIYIQQIMGKR